MLHLAAQPGALFIGQGVAYGGVATGRDLEGVPMEQLVEFPVAEELQLGVSVGLAMQGFLPVSIYPRFDFLLLAFNQLVNHLDKLAQMSQGQWNPKVIIRTRVGSKTPLDAGPQHTQDYTRPLRIMLKHVAVMKIAREDEVLATYQAAVRHPNSVVVVEAF